MNFEAASTDTQHLRYHFEFTPKYAKNIHRNDCISEPAKLASTHVKIALFSTPLFTLPPSFGGTENVVAILAKHLAKLGHTVTVYAPDGSKIEGCRIRECGKPQNTCYANWLQAETQMYQGVESELDEYDLIHSHNWFAPEYQAKKLNPNIKVCHTHHGGMNADWRRGKPFYLNTVAVSNWMRTVYEKQGIPSRVVHNGIDLEQYPLHTEKGERYLWISRVTFWKSPHTAIQIAKQTGIKLDIAGATRFKEDARYIAEIKKECDGTQIRFLGEVTNKQKIQLMSEAKALLTTSHWGEPFGLNVIEAMATGTKVIALADGALRETVQEGGVLCENIEEMKNALLHPMEIAPEMCRVNAERFSAENMARNYEQNIYKEILSNKEW